MEVLLNSTVLFALGLCLSIIVERVLEILKCAYDLVDSRCDWYHFWTQRAEKVSKKLEARLRVFEYASPKMASAALRIAHEVLLGKENGYTGTIPTVSGDLVRAFWIKVILKIVGVLFGIALALQFKVDFIVIWHTTYEQMKTAAAQTAIAATPLQEPTSLGMVLTGVAIGLGSGPVHKIITAIEKSWEYRKKRAGEKT